LPDVEKYCVKLNTHKKTPSFIVAILITSNVAGRDMFYRYEIAHTADKETNKQINYNTFFQKKLIFEARQILHILWNPKVEYLVYKEAPPVSLL
jgi:hypothetical protein